jgi:hypothetical protein
VPVQPASNSGTAQSPAMIMDRCSVGFGSGTGLSSRSATQGGKHPPLPMCVPQ